LIWRGQSARARSAQVGLPLMLMAVTVVVNAFPNQAVHHVQAHRQLQASPDPSPSPSPSPDATPASDSATTIEPVANGRGYRAAGCGPIPTPGPLGATYYPRIVIPRVGINLEIHPGDGGTPPENNWVAWFYPGLSHPGEAGNSYVYAHAHGQPQSSAPGLFWPLHYMHSCDAIYVYNSATSVFRYQTVSVDLHHSGWDDSSLEQTSDERLTLQTCNDWNPHGTKTIVVAERYADTPAPAPPAARQSAPGGASGGGSGAGSGGGAPSPQPQPSPSPIIGPLPLPTPPLP
jgi:LPXTG-site transpeptidase (sortase) family protein